MSTTTMDARVRVIRSGARSLARWYCSAACAAAEPAKQGAPARSPAFVPAGKRCARCNRKVAEHG